jgi:RNA polymerase sigma factor (sigma-70 family)
MAMTPLTAVLRHIRTLAAAGQFDDIPDGQLLERFAVDRDEIAFEVLMRRHGPLVRGACTRLLGNRPERDDVFQAVFMVLARKASSIRRRASVASWIYGVTLRLAREQRARLSRRHRREQTPGSLEEMAEKRPMNSDPVQRASMGELNRENRCQFRFMRCLSSAVARAAAR